MSKLVIYAGALLLIVMGIFIIRFIVHGLIQFVMIAAIFAAVLLAIFWLLTRKSGRPAARP